MSTLDPTRPLTPWLGAERTLGALDDALTASGADDLDIFITARAAHHTRFAADRIHQPQTIVELQIMVRAIAGTGAARVAVSDLRHLPEAVQRATAIARSRDGLPAAEPATEPAGPQRLATGLSLWSEATEGWNADVRSRQAAAIMAQATAAGCEASGTLTQAITELAVASTRGLRQHAAGTEAGFSVTLRKGENSSYLAELSRHVDRLQVGPRVGEAIARLAAAPDPVDLPDGVYDVVFGGLATGELIGFIPAFGFTSPAVRAGVGAVATRAGQQLADRSVTVADDALADVGLPFAFDLEGSAKRRVALLDGGVVGGAVSDRATAAATGGVSTGHAHIGREQSPEPEAANLMMSAGQASEPELIAGVQRGVYVQRLWYNRLVDAEVGTVLGTIRDGCWRIGDGRLTVPVRGARFTESVIGALQRTDGLGATLISQPVMNVWNGCVTAPAIRVRGFRFGGRPLQEGLS